MRPRTESSGSMNETASLSSLLIVGVSGAHLCLHTVCLVSSELPGDLLRRFCPVLAASGGPANRRGRGGGHRGRGRFNVRRDGPVKFEKDFDFESANAQFNKEEIDREFQDKLKLKGACALASPRGPPPEPLHRCDPAPPLR